MNKRMLFAGITLLAVTVVQAQQVADPEYRPPLSRPAYQPGQGPVVLIDEAHHNFHTAQERYRPFAELLRRDGYRVDGCKQPFSAASLKGVDVLVIANALNERNVEEWTLPTPSAFRADEIKAVRAWVEEGGSLFLIADHMPFAGAADDLGKALGVEFSNGFAVSKPSQRPSPFTFGQGTGLVEGAVTLGRSQQERVTKVVTFTGSAFKPPKDAMPILLFNADYVSLKPETAWQFSATTEREPLDGWCQGAIIKIGKGRAAVFGEAAMFTAQLAGPTKAKTGMNSPEAGQNYLLLLNILHWLSHAKDMRE